MNGENAKVVSFSLHQLKTGCWRLYASTARSGCALRDGSEDELRTLARSLGTQHLTLRQALRAAR